MKTKPYPEYKDSGVPWLGHVPQNWVNYPGMAVLKEKQVRNTGLKEKTVLSLSYGKIKVKSMDKLHGLVPESFETYQIVEPGDIIIRATDLQNDKTSLRTGKVKDKGIITSAYLRLKPQPAFDKDYAHALLHGLDLMKVFYGMGSGLRQNLSWTDFKRMPFFLPPLPEQNQIARYLDWKTVQIAKFIKDKKRMIELLKEQKQVIINDAVTGKIDVTTGKPYLKYKDSGVEWLEQVPDDWEIIRCSYLFKEKTDIGYPDLELLSITIDKGIIRQSDTGRRTRASEDRSFYKRIEKGDLGYNLMNAFMGGIAFSQYDGILSPAYAVAKPLRKMDCDYFNYLFRTKRCGKEIDRLSYGIMYERNRLYFDRFKLIQVVLPRIEEQEKISEYIRYKFSFIDLAISRTEREIGLMQEYRDRLIADVVTGKLDVRGIAVPEVLEELSADDADSTDEELDEIENEDES